MNTEQEQEMGLLERTYEEAMCVEMDRRRLRFTRQAMYPVKYKGTDVGEHRIDLIVEDAVVVELESVERFDPVFVNLREVSVDLSASVART